MMRLPVGAAFLGVAFAVLTAGPGAASVSVKTKTITYKIKGSNGEALIEAMDRKGPRHGFMTRAIAQTGYTISWDLDWREKSGSCRVVDADATLKITYNYPEVTGDMSLALERRWAAFMRGVHRHEETHGQIARQMVKSAESALIGLTSKNDRHCRKLQADAKDVIAGVYDRYEADQMEFDEVEHSEGGNVERLLRALAKGK